nr:tetratricopeptide repeat protein [uncultured Devosia sp.]
MTEPAPRLFSLAGIEGLSSTIRTMFINIGFFVAMLLLIPAVASQFSTSAVVIEPIAVPEALVERGITPEVAANRLWDGLQDFARTASVARSTIVAIPDSQRVEFSLPDTGISIDSVSKQVRQFFGLYETHIAGEIICDTTDCAPAGQRLRLRIIRATTEIVDLPPIGDRSEPDYFRDAAAGVFDVLDPFVAIAARAITDPEGAATRARRLALGNHPDAKWAHNLLGDIARTAGDTDAAIADYRAALALDGNFNLARINLARALAESGDFAAADATLAEATTLEPQAATLPTARAEIALARDDRPGAIAAFLAAAELAPVDPTPLVRAGELELQQNQTEAGMAHLEEALDLDPGHPDALRLLGEAYRADGDLAAAERLFKDWADYAPGSTDAHLALAELLLERNDAKGAAAHYDRLVALDPASFDYATARTQVLLDLGRYAQAVDGLTPFADAEPPEPAAVLLLARVQHQAGRTERAIERYRQYLTLLPDAPEKAEVEAALLELGG